MYPIVKYSKSYTNLFSLKKDLYQDNKNYLKNLLKVNELYKKQPKRKNCKNCLKKIGKKIFFSHGVDYTLCKNCGHLNGIYQDSKDFIRKLYSNNNGKNYYPNYTSDYIKRIKIIYEPKIHFLKKIIKKKINILDIGSGAGQLLKACEIMNINATGYETNQSLVDHGNKFLKKNKLNYLDLNKSYEQVKTSNANVLTMISVLEHLEDPQKIIDYFKNSNLQYLYICVPLFSLAVLFENVFQNIYPRVLGGAHTHLYTEQSLRHLSKKNNLKILGEWWFGADIPDLFRMIMNSSTSYEKDYQNIIKKKFLDMCDDLQKTVDKNKFCSQVHMVFKK
jgi:2-polyprenyl-3-methyl-5-hydroxy-6-metoxy-1,4-benzoquinol methylase